MINCDSFQNERQFQAPKLRVSVKVIDVFDQSVYRVFSRNAPISSIFLGLSYDTDHLVDIDLSDTEFFDVENLLQHIADNFMDKLGRFIHNVQY